MNPTKSRPLSVVILASTFSLKTRGNSAGLLQRDWTCKLCQIKIFQKESSLSDNAVCKENEIQTSAALSGGKLHF